MSLSRQVAAVLVAAGRGTRAGGAVPKQYQPIGGQPLIRHALGALAAHPLLDRVVVVIGAADADLFGKAFEGLQHGRCTVSAIDGGDTRQESVRAGLEALAALGLADDAVVLIHDAARPFLSESLVTRAIAAAAAEGAAIPLLAIPDTVAELDAAGALLDNPPRDRLRLVQTPQAFRFGLILDAHRAAAAQSAGSFTDDAGLARWHGAEVTGFAGDPALFKITGPEDFARAERHLTRRPRRPRTGFGFDVHAFGPGEAVMLGGLSIPHDRGLIGHSDADPLLHALTDAILGAIADGDIGQHFPPSDPRWKGAASEIFLIDAVRRVRARGGELIHLDATLVCEAPRLTPHRAEMQAMIARIAGLAVGNVGLKATTSEKLGFTGRREGIAAFATATVMLEDELERDG